MAANTGKLRFTIRSLVSLIFVFASPMLAKSNWKILEPGLELADFKPSLTLSNSASKIRILRISPKHFQLELFNASAPDQGQSQTAKQWCVNNKLVAAINSSMYRKDYRTSVSYMRTRTHINNPYLSRDKSVLAFDAFNSNVPEVKMIDRECDSFSDWKSSYGSFVQSIRMISCKQKNVWSKQPQKWSIAAIGIDRSGNILFIHSKTPFTTHDFINQLLKMPINIRQAMYAEGGSEAQLFIQSNGKEYQFTGLPEGSENGFQIELNPTPIPNILGISRKVQSR